jgi:structure-specific recognition protein 1
MASSSNNNSIGISNNEPVITWKHIGLYGYAVGTLALYPDAIVWKSALLGRHHNANNSSSSSNGNQEDDMDTDGNMLSTMTTTRKIPAMKLTFAKWTAMGKNIGLVRLGILNTATSSSNSNSNSSKNAPPYQQDWRLDGFPASDYDLLSQKLQSLYRVPLQTHTMSAAGTQYGIPLVVSPASATSTEKWLTLQHCIVQDDLNEEGQELQVLQTNPICHFDLNEITQCVIPANNNRNEIELQFPESDTIEAGTDQLGRLYLLMLMLKNAYHTCIVRTARRVPFTYSRTFLVHDILFCPSLHYVVSIRMYIPPDPDADPTDKETMTAAESLQEKILNTANIRKNASTSDVLLVSFDPSKGAFLTPRGRYAIELYDTYLRMRGQKYDYKIRYDDINRLFLLPKPDEVHMAFVIALDKPIRQGNQRYQYLVMQASKDPDEVVVHMDDATLQKEYAGELQQVMRGSLSNLIAKTFKVIANKKVFIPGKFANANQQASLSCSVRANEGLLYPYVLVSVPSSYHSA